MKGSTSGGLHTAISAQFLNSGHKNVLKMDKNDNIIYSDSKSVGKGGRLRKDEFQLNDENGDQYLQFFGQPLSLNSGFFTNVQLSIPCRFYTQYPWTNGQKFWKTSETMYRKEGLMKIKQIKYSDDENTGNNK
jgi:hypothetical protein